MKKSQKGFFQGLGRKACDGPRGGRQSSDRNMLAASNSLDLHSDHIWAQNGTQSSSFGLGNIYSFLHLVTRGHMVQKEALNSS